MDATPPPSDPELSALADTVWAERAVLEQLAFKLVELNLVLGADLRRFVGRCLDEVEAASDLLERVERRRADALAALTGAWRRPAGSLDLRQLASEAPEPWATVFADHRDHLRALVAEVERTRAASRDLCAAALAQVEDDLDSVSGATRRALDGAPVSPRHRTPLRLVGSGITRPTGAAREGSLA